MHKQNKDYWASEILLQSSVFHILFIFIVVLLSYSNTFRVPFIFDDIPNIAENPVIRDVSNFLRVDSLKANRYIGNLSFAINYRLGGFDVVGYHIVNLVIHMVNGLLVYLLVVYSFRTPWLRGSKFNTKVAGLFSALLFVSHPLQTQAVTYIVQRYASLATLFYLLSLVMYLRWRAGSGKLKVFWYILSVVSAVLAMKTKEIAFTLPVVIVLYEFLFFDGKVGKRILYTLPHIMTMLIIPISLLGINRPLGEIIGNVDKATMVAKEMSRLEYLFTEFRVIMTYLRLIILPIKQNLDYDYPVYHSFFEIEVVGSFIVLICLFLVGLYFIRISRGGRRELRLVGFGIIWFFITLSVESSFIPIPDVIYEHRMYLPMVGVVLCVVAGGYILQDMMSQKAVVTAVLTVAVIALSATTYARNNVWRDELTLWTDVVNKSPEKARVYNNLGQVYTKKGMFDKAIESFKTSIRLRPNHPLAYYNLGNTYMLLGDIDRAIKEYNIAIRIKPNYLEAHTNLGIAYKRIGRLKDAINEYLIVLRLRPDFAVAHYNLANAYLAAGEKEKAIRHYRIAITLNPSLKNWNLNVQ